MFGDSIAGCKEVVIAKQLFSSRLDINRCDFENVVHGQFEPNAWLSSAFDAIACELRVEVLKHTVCVTPASWWHHFKQDCMPKWFVKKWPVKYIEKEVVIRCDPSLDSPGPVVRFVGYDKPKVINYERNGDIR